MCSSDLTAVQLLACAATAPTDAGALSCAVEATSTSVDSAPHVTSSAIQRVVAEPPRHRPRWRRRHHQPQSRYPLLARSSEFLVVVAHRSGYPSLCGACGNTEAAHAGADKGDEWDAEQLRWWLIAACRRPLAEANSAASPASSDRSACGTAWRAMVASCSNSTAKLSNSSRYAACEGRTGSQPASSAAMCSCRCCVLSLHLPHEASMWMKCSCSKHAMFFRSPWSPAALPALASPERDSFCDRRKRAFEEPSRQLLAGCRRRQSGAEWCPRAK